VKALTVQQPWAWAIVHGGKDVENRTQAWSYRGPLAIHAGARVSERGCMSSLVVGAAVDEGISSGMLAADRRDEFVLGALLGGGIKVDPEHTQAIIGVVDLVDAHTAENGCCESPWAEMSCAELGGRTRRDVVHLVLEHPRPLWKPIPAKGRLGLWNVTGDVLVELVGDGALTGHVVA
jgi:hypothetical protein